MSTTTESKKKKISFGVPDNKTPRERESIDPVLQKLSQKVMKKTWDNKEDEFWNTY